MLSIAYKLVYAEFILSTILFCCCAAGFRPLGINWNLVRGWSFSRPVHCVCVCVRVRVCVLPFQDSVWEPCFYRCFLSLSLSLSLSLTHTNTKSIGTKWFEYIQSHIPIRLHIHTYIYMNSCFSPIYQTNNTHTLDDTQCGRRLWNRCHKLLFYSVQNVTTRKNKRRRRRRSLRSDIDERDLNWVSERWMCDAWEDTSWYKHTHTYTPSGILKFEIDFHNIYWIPTYLIE